jgi:hypothetical protein
MDETTLDTNQTSVERVEDFVSGYSNNVQFENSAWNLKILFGELDLSGPKPVIEQHTAITVSWVEAKLLAYFLQIQIAAHELENGKVQIPTKLLPPDPTVSTEGPFKEIGTKLYRQFISGV